MTGFTLDDGWGLSALIVLCIVFLVVLALGFLVIRGETRIHRTRLGVFLERDRFENGQEEDAGAGDTRELGPGDIGSREKEWPQ